jgi:hypothetical protein
MGDWDYTEHLPLETRRDIRGWDDFIDGYPHETKDHPMHAKPVIYKKPVWVTKDGQHIKFKDLEQSHLKNIIKMVSKKQGEDCDLVKMLKEHIKETPF